ncbi:TSUP family transporter [Clostridium rectalis]|uniref:TSUP family transporter n=1 Tax=Clostridium rectalis TaxID=2040295 RepID=UPI001FAA378F|nr:TSUP family transporter [Clostridium rectalis]
MLATVPIVYKVIFLCAAGFLSAFVDSIAGGGGLISIPAYFLVGFPPHYTLGTNKFSATSGSLVSTIKFAQSGKVDNNILKILVPCAFLGASAGVTTVLLIDPNILKPIVLFLLLAVGIYSFFSKTVGMEDNFKGVNRKNLILGGIFAFAMGFYDGFFGPGTGSFLIFGLIGIYGFDFVRASGNAKALNFTSNVTALILFAINGKIMYLMGIPMGIFMVFGAYTGSKVALKQGARFIKPIFIIMSFAVAVKMIYEMFIL